MFGIEVASLGDGCLEVVGQLVKKNVGLEEREVVEPLSIHRLNVVQLVLQSVHRRELHFELDVKGVYTMAKGKLILICHSGGEFATNDDGTLSYNGGEANAANVTSETPFNDLKLQLAEVCDLDQKTVTLKYFLPGNKKNLIVVKNDKE
ncbi:hypothetical protein OSB04_021249 [Centaurea solstitialis]|uniref:Uncharacterized protein n=1 Tax=Centaurea solstitialis TaxID=347529 RepID=A0AA38WHL5_9ASTR|nr:hypothetical protein OSB04_021249 [Centaurea solstitialis]